MKPKTFPTLLLMAVVGPLSAQELVCRKSVYGVGGAYEATFESVVKADAVEFADRGGTITIAVYIDGKWSTPRELGDDEVCVVRP